MYSPLGTSTWECTAQVCNFKAGYSVPNGQQSPIQLQAKGAAAPPVEDPQLNCDTNWNPLTWLGCPVLHLINTTINSIDRAIINLLTVESDTIFNEAYPPGHPQAGQENKAGVAYKSAWSSFRTIALGILVVGALIMIIGQALGFAALDAYTVKKVIPRLLVAVIGIALSWDIMKFFVEFTNNLGIGVRQLIFWPFRGIGDNHLINDGGSAIITLLTLGAIPALGLGGLLAFAGTALLALLIAFMVLVLRQLIIVVLILFAPIAIAAYILPNTQGIWKLWYESFTKALMMFPIIMAFLAVGRVMAQTSSNGSIVGEIVAFVAYIMPYFLIPLTVRFAGGALRTVGGFVNDRGRGGFDRLKKYRQGKIASNFEAMKHGTRFNERPDGKGFRAKFNTFTQTAASVPDARIGYNPSQWKNRLSSHMSNHDDLAADEALEKNANVRGFSGNDDFIQAARYGKGDDNETLKYLTDKSIAGHEYDEDTAKRAVALIRRARMDMSPEVFDRVLAKALPATGTAWKTDVDDEEAFDKETGEIKKGGAGEMFETIIQAAHGDGVARARMFAKMRSDATRAGRHELAGGSFSQGLRVMEDLARGYTVVGKDKDGKDITQVVDAKWASNKMWEYAEEANGGYQWANARQSTWKAEAIRMHVQFRDKAAERIDKRTAIMKDTSLTPEKRQQLLDVADRDFMRQGAKIKAVLEEMGRAAPEKAEVFANDIMGQRITDMNGSTGSVRQVLEQISSDPVFQQYRREYTAARDADELEKINRERQRAADNEAQGQSTLPGMRP
ncbi:MAG TPA: hypothetical protein VK978_04630 [Candidatus Saccharimonadales bacterium]|nr:hypothetical protein [Candidatus Saccharimonadales bacterium]